MGLDDKIDHEAQEVAGRAGQGAEQDPGQPPRDEEPQAGSKVVPVSPAGQKIKAIFKH